MATTALSNLKITTMDWLVAGLGADFNTTNYIRVGIATGQLGGESTPPPSGILDDVTAPGSGTDREAGDTVTGLTAATSYPLYGFAQAANTKYYPAGSDTESTLGFAWYAAKTQGSAFNITAAEWNAFCSAINAVRSAYGTGAYSFTSAVQGNAFTAVQHNEARTSINDMSPGTAVPSAVSQGGDVTAATINGLLASLNSVTW